MGFPKPSKDCDTQTVTIPEVKCEDVVESRCQNIPRLVDDPESVESCQVVVGEPKCSEVELVLPKQVRSGPLPIVPTMQLLLQASFLFLSGVPRHRLRLRGGSQRAKGNLILLHIKHYPSDKTSPFSLQVVYEPPPTYDVHQPYHPPPEHPKPSYHHPPPPKYPHIKKK